MWTDQLGPLLWKNYVIRKRQPGILALVFLWPVAVFMMLYTVRDNVEPEYHPTCQFPARSMPQDGLLPFVQSYICSVGNPCDLLEEYEELPSYTKAALGPLLVELQPMLRNETVLAAIRTLPNSIQLLRSMAEILTRPEIKSLFDRGIRLGDLFNNHDEIKKYLRVQLPNAGEELIDGLFRSSIKLYYLIDTFGSSNVDGVICSPDSLRKYLIVPRDEDFERISSALCDIDASSIPDILQHLSKYLDFRGLLARVDRVMAKFREYDFFQDLRRAATTIVNLDTVKKYAPQYLRLQEWLPKIITIFQNVTFKEIDLTFVNKSIEVLDPIFETERDWPIARRGLRELNAVLTTVKSLRSDRTIEPDDFFSVIKRLKGNVKYLVTDDTYYDNITLILDTSFLVLQDGMKLTKKLLERHEDDIDLTAEAFDRLKGLFSERIVNTLTYLASMIQNVVQAIHHVAVLHEDVSRRIFEVCREHQELVHEILADFTPEIYRKLIRSFSRLDFVERLVSDGTVANPDEVLCQEDTFNEIFVNSTGPAVDYVKLNDTLCSASGKKFILDIFNAFELDHFADIVTNTLATLVLTAFKQPVRIQYANLTSVVRVTKEFIAYLESPKLRNPEWGLFAASDEWRNAFEETRSQGRMDVLGVHLSIAKAIGSRSLSFITIKPDLEIMDMLAEVILQDMHSYPTDWISEVRAQKPQLIESFYLTAADKEKTLQILEYANFSRSYCADPDPPALLNFPKGSNETLLKELVCRISKSVQAELELNATAIALEEAAYRERRTFNWTSFNERTIEIYQYIDTLVHQEDTDYDTGRLDSLIRDFEVSWTKNLTARNVWEISVGLICKLFDVMESPIFGGPETAEWRNAHALAWASSVIFDSLERTVDQIQSNDNVAKLSDIAQTLPQTEILLNAFLRNLAPVVLDVTDILSTNLPVHLITALGEYNDREPNWPCVQNESVGSALELRNGTRSVVREVERIACNPGLFIREWQEQPVLTRVRKIFQQDNTVLLPVFNWTAGYSKFRRLVNKLDDMVNDAKQVVLAEDPKLATYVKTLSSGVEDIFYERLPGTRNESSTVLGYVDLELDKAVGAFRGSLAADAIWVPSVDPTDRVLVLVKFCSHMLHRASGVIRDVLRDGTGSIGLLSLLGFNGDSPVSIIHDQLPYVLATFVNGLSNPAFDGKLMQRLESGGKVTCADLFDWLSDFRVGLSCREYKIMKTFICDLDPENFNAYTDLVMYGSAIWRSPVRQYRSYVATGIGDLYDLGHLLTATLKGNVTIVPLFAGDYLKNALAELRDSLELKEEGIVLDQDATQSQDWIAYRVFSESISEALLHSADALNSAEITDDELHTWQLVQHGDVRQVLRILESHPEETVALVARLSTLEDATHDVPDFKGLRHTMCHAHFESGYWETARRARFLKELCSFDPYQLLKTITSEEVYNVVVHGAPLLLRSTPLTLSVTRFLDGVTNLTARAPSMTLRSNIFNATTLKGLSNETLALVRDAERSWVRAYTATPESARTFVFGVEGRPVAVEVSRIFELIDSAADLLSGGDIWQKLRDMYDSTKMKQFLTLAEDVPSLIVTAVDTFVSSEILSDFIEKLYAGHVHPCDVDRYLVPSSFIRNKGLLARVANFCRRMVLDDRPIEIVDLLPFEATVERQSHVARKAPGRVDYERLRTLNETILLKTVYHFQTTLIRVLSEGFKELQVPSWWTSFAEGTYKDFVATYAKKDGRAVAHSVVKKFVALFKDFAEKSLPADEECSWCNTLVAEIVNSQLRNHRLYTKLLCQLTRLNASEVHDVLLRDFYWNKTVSMVKDYKYLTNKRTLNQFVDTVEGTLHYVADIIVDYRNATHREKVAKCFDKFVGSPSYTRIGLYTSFLQYALDLVQRNSRVVVTASNSQEIKRLTKLTEEHVPIWRSLREVVKSTDADEVDRLLPNATINVNAIVSGSKRTLCRTEADCRNATVLYEFLSSKRAGKVLRYDPKASGYPSAVEISDQLSRSLDLALVQRERPGWRREASWNLTWLTEILRHVSAVLNEGGNLLDVASKIDFADASNVLGVPDLADGIVNILKDKTVDKLFDGMKEILEDAEPIINDPDVARDAYSMIVALESMEIFKNLGLLDMKYLVSDMFENWEVVRSYLLERVNVSNDVLGALSQSKIDMISIFMKERGAVSLKDTICSPQRLGEMLNFEEGHVTAEEVSPVLCQLNDTQTQNVTITLIMNLNFDYIFKTLMNANVKNILSNANLTETEGKAVLDSVGVASELMPFFKEKLSSGLSPTESAQEESDGPISSSRFLRDSSEMLCGRPLIQDSGQIYKILASIEDNSKEFDRAELDSLPSDFCRDAYKSMIAMNGGKIIWSYIKPLLRGRILYAPDTTAIAKVMSLANESFVQMENFGTLLGSFERTLGSLVNLTEIGDSLKELQEVMASDVMRIAIKSFAGDGPGNFNGDFSDLNLSEMAWRLKKSKKTVTMVGMLNDLMGCVLVDRIKGFSTERELEEYARALTDTNEFLAAVVFLDVDTQRTKRSEDALLPDNVTYKIRMDVDYVPSTRRLKTQFWIPGPESSFVEDLRYLRGFIQLQDAVDRAIIRLKTGREQNWATVTQQMPYPCWKHAPFQITLYESQGVQVCFFFALMMCVGSAVRHIVWERESQNAMVMSVMGLQPWLNTFAWFVTTFVELIVVMLSIGTILLAGKILPRSDPILVLVLMIDYVFSIVTFCYMISTMFSSASLSAITTVVMFLLTYMPYVIVIAMEAAIGLGYKLLICLSMSTSFCYGCLYAVRKEVQGVGLTWGNMWEESTPTDPMSLGLVLLMIALDGCIYALIGYLVARYTNSGRGLHGLRSRSLWWADTRSNRGGPDYYGFVNNLYFTNDVLQPSDTYQDEESDANSLTVSEKQIGVKFEGVRKVYHTERGDVVAVEDFTLKLCEGEVTSLLGRNGAGKTTIIKMLTGMVAPTSGEICLSSDEGSKPDIGVCPQDNVLIGTLTPREHMVFYARLKRPSNALDVERDVNEMLASLELGRQEHEPVCRLSGGTRRRLCVALAFLCSPKLVILDEPGAGVDPAARRRIWRLIDRHRIGRTVVLSTHHLDEADMLSDTVVVMHKGRILCTGSPLKLKLTHGRGYRMHVLYPRGQDGTGVDRRSLETLRAIAEAVVPNAAIDEASESEVVVTLPFQEKNGVSNDIAKAALALEENRKALGYSHFSMECDTLERVFLDLCARADNGTAITKASQDSVASMDHTGLCMPEDDVDLIDVEPLPRPSPFRQAKAMLRKRLWHFTKDWRSPLAALVLPTMFVAVAMGFSLIRPPSEDEPPLLLTPKLYDTHSTNFYSIDGSNDAFLQHVSLQLHDRFGDDYAGAWQILPNDTGSCGCSTGQQICRGVSQAVEGLVQTLPGRPTLDWLVSTHQEYIEKRYGGWSLSHRQDDPLFVVWYNNKGHHSLPSYLSALNEAILRASGVPGHLRTVNHPLKMSRDQLNRTTLLQHVADVGVALVLLIAFSLVGAQGARELVRERLSEEKRILYLAGMHPVTYWVTALIWDLFVFGLSICLAVVVFEIFGLSAYTAKDNLPGVCLLLALFAWAAVPFSHLAEKWFDDPSLSNMVLFCVNTFIGVASLATILVIDIVGKTKAAEDTRDVLHRVLMLLPQYVLGDAMVQLSKNDITAELLGQFHMDTYQSPLGWELLGAHYVFLAAVGAALLALNLLIECRMFPRSRGRGVVCETFVEDEDVARERARVESGCCEDALRTVRLRKEYRSVYGTNVAVESLSVGVQAGQCFGLLGVNGAGKSTTFKMLTTELTPTAGRILLRDREVGAGPLCDGEVGYCPQTDALDGFLTPHQCLTVHGEVCGLSNVARAVELTLRRFDLLKYAHQRVSSLSGGNKRKLCAAVSVMAPVSVVLMDEPTSGMDPATKYLVAKAVQRVTKKHGCVVLTSHSVAECENLCGRVGILAKAGLRCIGTPQHLKHKFGEGYVAFLRFGQPVPPADLMKAISKCVPRAVVSSRQASAARLLLPRSQDMPLSEGIAKVKLLAEELKATDYTLTQSSLDQVLVNFSEALEDDAIDMTRLGQNNGGSLPKLYSTMDVIHMDTF